MDLVGACVAKFATYHSLAFSITYAVPLLFYSISLVVSLVEVYLLFGHLC